MNPLESRSFCVLPWIHLNANPDGTIALCCQSPVLITDEGGRPLSLQTHSAAEIWSSPALRDLRRRIAEGEQLPHCERCFENERHGHGSYRLISQRRWLGDHPAGAQLRAAIGAVVEWAPAGDPLYFDLRLGNICNLKCTACKPHYSSQIERDPVHSRWATAPYQRLGNRFGTQEDWSEAAPLMAELLALSGNLRLIQLAGGEPMINKTQMALLRRLVDAGRADEIDLEIVTNLTNVSDSVLATFSHFKSLSACLSIDGHGPVYRYVRYPARWETLTANVARLRAAHPDVALSINAVLQAVNATNLVALLEWAVDEGIRIGVSIGRGLDHYNDVRLLPPALRRAVRQEIEEMFRRKSNRGVENVRRQVITVLDEIDAIDITEAERRERIVGFMQFVNDMDRSRRLSLRILAPALHQAVAEYCGGWDESLRFA